MEELAELTDQHIKEFLEDSPLYIWREFKMPKLNRIGLWINQIDAFCETCKQIRPFQDNPINSKEQRKKIEDNWRQSDEIEQAFNPRQKPIERKRLSTGQTYFEFLCVSCRKERYKFCVHQLASEDTIKLQKFGELPRKQLERYKLLQKFFSDDSDCYEKAVVCLSHGYGIAAFAYLRRIIENNILKLLDVLQEDINSSGGNIEIEKALAELRKESPTSDKIKIANNALPAYLKPDGLNPLGKLYGILSDGVHQLSDQECLERADIVKECLKFLISELATRKENSSRFKKMVGSLSK